jgi:hypothetical protein
MIDPRIVLKDELIAIGISPKQASIIALDTGSSQVIVNKEYLEDFSFSKIITTKALAMITKFFLKVGVSPNCLFRLVSHQPIVK